MESDFVIQRVNTPASQASFLLGVVYWILVLGIRSEYNDAGHLHLSASDHHSSDETLRQSQPCDFLTNLFSQSLTS